MDLPLVVRANALQIGRSETDTGLVASMHVCGFRGTPVGEDSLDRLQSKGAFRRSCNRPCRLLVKPIAIQSVGEVEVCLRKKKT